MATVAFVFPGQGSQEVGMLGDLDAAVRPLFDEASGVLGYDLWDLVANGPAEQLNQTEFTQPALLTASVALWQQFCERSPLRPTIVAGHSLGEYSALVAAGVLAFSDAVALVQKRGQFMQTAVPVGQGGMAAILGLDDDIVIGICESVADQGVVQAANFNAPGQIVIAGANAALEAAVAACKDAGAKRAMPLAVSAPFHSAMMEPAAESMSGELAARTFNAPVIRIIQNIDADFCDDPTQIRANLVRQMSGAVQWSETVRQLAAQGVTDIVECGPGRVLAGLVKRIDKQLATHNINSAATLDAMGAELGA